jgi:hypothetical protein
VRHLYQPLTLACDAHDRETLTLGYARAVDAAHAGGRETLPAGLDPLPAGLDPLPAGLDPLPAGLDPLAAGPNAARRTGWSPAAISA